MKLRSNGYYYRLGEFSIHSDLLLPELHSSSIPDGEPDIEFMLAKVPESLPQPEWDWTSPRLQLTKETALYTVPDTARYLIEGGRKVRITPSPSAAQENVRAFLLGTVFGILCHQRGAFPLHASAVIANDTAYAFVGPSGAGKSTTGAWLATRGFPLLSDDICTLTGIDDNTPTVQSGAPRIKLWLDALDTLGIDPQGLQRDSNRTDKFHLIANQSAPVNRARLGAIYLLTNDETSPVHIQGPLKALDAIAAISDNTYRVELLAPLGLSARHFQRCAALARNVPVFRLHRPRDLGALNSLAKALEAHWV